MATMACEIYVATDKETRNEDFKPFHGNIFPEVGARTRTRSPVLLSLRANFFIPIS